MHVTIKKKMPLGSGSQQKVVALQFRNVGSQFRSDVGRERTTFGAEAGRASRCGTQGRQQSPNHVARTSDRLLSSQLSLWKQLPQTSVRSSLNNRLPSPGFFISTDPTVSFSGVNNPAFKPARA